jgi:phage-related baseplate assembly protein
VRPVNDQVVIRNANIVNYNVDATLILQDGADPNTVVTQQTAALTAFCAARTAIGTYVSPDNIAAVLGYSAANLVYDVTVSSPAAKVGGGPFDAPIISGMRVVWQRRMS